MSSTLSTIFTYGSLMCLDIMERVAGCSTGHSQATLKNYYRSKVQNEEYPGIMPLAESTVSGVVYHDIPPEALQRLDLFEGELYERLPVSVDLETGATITAFAYVIRQEYRHILTGEEWSFAEFLASGKKKFEDAYVGFKAV